MIGFPLAAVGLDSISGDLRMTFGMTHMMRGFDFLIAVIGLFGIAEILLTIEDGLNFPAAGEDRPQGRAADLEGACPHSIG